MSGGYFEYINDRACNEIFGWSLCPDYGDRGFAQSAAARRMNPLDDLVMSELVWDVFCVLHSFDWARSGDTGEEDYRSDVECFKKKWLKPMRGKRAKEIVDDELQTVRKKLYVAFDIRESDES